MRIRIFGGNGMLGHKLLQVLGTKFDVWATVRGTFDDVERCGIFEATEQFENVDATDIERVRSSIYKAKPDIVINAVGVVKQNSASEDLIKTLAINAVFPQHLSAVSREYGFRLITISTDCVFNGEKGNYTEKDLPNAHDLYGISKFLGEIKDNNCLTLRTSIIGRELDGRQSLIEWFLSNRGKTVKGFVNATYSGFPTIVFAEIVSSIITDHHELEGVYHVSSDPINKFDLLNLVNNYYDAKIDVEPSNDFVIDRSLDSTAFRKAADFSPPDWGQMIEQMASDPTPYESWKQ